MDRKNEILNFLEKNKADNINMINFIENYPISYMEKIGQSVLIKGISDRNWVYISSKSAEELEIIKGKLDKGDRNFAIVEDWMIPILIRGFKIKWKLSTMKLVLEDNMILSVPNHAISDLKAVDAAFIYESSDYKEYLSIEYIKERIMNGKSSCIRILDKPIAWAITQDDGAIGFLHVLPEYRRQGYASDVTVDIINKVRDKGGIPFVHIEEDNEKSMGLALGMGFKKDKRVNWFELE
jgi:Acetyltransferases